MTILRVEWVPAKKLNLRVPISESEKRSVVDIHREKMTARLTLSYNYIKKL